MAAEIRDIINGLQKYSTPGARRSAKDLQSFLDSHSDMPTSLKNSDEEKTKNSEPKGPSISERAQSVVSRWETQAEHLRVILNRGYREDKIGRQLFLTDRQRSSRQIELEILDECLAEGKSYHYQVVEEGGSVKVKRIRREPKEKPFKALEYDGEDEIGKYHLVGDGSTRNLYRRYWARTS